MAIKDLVWDQLSLNFPCLSSKTRNNTFLSKKLW